MYRQSNEIKDQDLQRISYQEYVDEQQFTKIDLRQKVIDMNKHPYNTIGRIVSKKQYIHQSIKKQAEKMGIGCLIHPKIVLTVAHVIYFSNLGIHSGIAENIQFLHLNKGKTMKVKQCKFNQKYLSKKNFDTEIYDVAILILEEEAEIKESEAIIMDNSHYFSDTQLEIITVLTILKDTQSNELNFYEQKNTIQKVDTSKIFYRHTTKSGDSGGPILISFNNDHLLIGLHKACSFKTNFGLIIQALLKQNQFLEEITKHYKIKTKNELLPQKNKQTDIKLSLKQNDNPNLLSETIKQEKTTLYNEDKSYNVLKDPSQYLQINKQYIKSHSKNQKGEVICLQIPYLAYKLSNLDVQEFYQYDWYKLEKLKFVDCLKTITNLKLFFQKSILLPSLKYLQMTHMETQFGDEGIYELIKCIKTGSFKRLNCLELQHNNITANGIKHLAQNAGYLNVLNKVDEEQMRYLSTFAEKSPKLKLISLDNCQVGFQEIKVLSENAQKWKNIKKLWLSNNKIGDKQLTEFCKNAHKFLDLQTLYFNRNYIGDEGWKSLVKYGENFIKLRLILLDLNKITEIKEGDLNIFQKLDYIDFGKEQSRKNPLSSSSIKVLTKYKNEHTKVTVNFYQ